MDIERLQRECNLYKRLIEFGRQAHLQPLLQDILTLAVDATDAEQGYLELYDDTSDEDPARPPTWWYASGCTDADVEHIRAVCSRGILARALATHATVRTPSARDDQRFADNPSVRIHGIRAVLCTPLGQGHGESGSIGALYLQRRRGFAPFSDRDEKLALLLAEHVTPFVTRLLWLHQQRDDADPTRTWRQQLRLDTLVGRSQALARVFRDVSVIARRDVTLLITGESGTGKTTLARAIHNSGPRRARLFQELSCAAIPEELAESELFGAMPGSHSTAHKRLPGKVAEAEGGTLFLDEVDQLSLRMQAKLLQLLQSKTYRPLGAGRPVTADIRIVAATNADLEVLVAERRFREDLYYRLNVMPIRMPALRERREDVPVLAEYLCRAFQDGDHEAMRIATAGVRALQQESWPGNIRQLANVIQRGFLRALGDHSPTIDVHHLWPDRQRSGGDDETSFQVAVDTFKRNLLDRTLRECNWNVSEAARRLKLPRSSMNRYISQLRIGRPD